MKTSDDYILRFKGLSLGKHRFDFSVGEDFFQGFESSVIPSGHARVSVDVEKQSNMIGLDFTIDGKVRVPCDRCLEEFDLPVEYRGTLIVRFSETPDEGDGDILWLHPGETELDLSQYIYESIGLSLPFQTIHPEDENGNSGCDPQMLARFRVVTGEEFDKMYPETEEQPNPQWQEQLGRLKEKLEKEENK